MLGKRSALSLTAIEAISAGVAGAGTALFHFLVLWPGWEQYGSELFRRFGIPFAIFACTGAVFLIRTIRKDVPHMSWEGSLALAWPMLGNIPVIALAWSTLAWSTCPIWPIGLVFAVIAALEVAGSREKSGNLLALPWNLTWLFLAVKYMAEFW